MDECQFRRLTNGFDSRVILSLIAGLGLSLAACHSAQIKRIDYEANGDQRCRGSIESYQSGPVLEWLDRMTELMRFGCYKEATVLGPYLRDNFREKTYSVSREAASVFIPDEMVTEYVLESYERVYLSIMIASSFLAFGDRESAEVELRRAESEARAIVYNFGADPVNVLLIAAFWDNLGKPELSRPYWQNLHETLGADSVLATLAAARIDEIDRAVQLQTPWKIYGVGEFPELTWGVRFLDANSGYYRIEPAKKFESSCASRSGIKLSTEPWMQKIAARYDQEYHPLLNAKSWTRLSVGLVYGATTATVGAAVMFSGCSKNSSPVLCEQTIKMGVDIIMAAPKAASFGIQPDLRHWRRVPSSVLVTKAASLETEDCLGSPDRSEYLNVVDFFGAAFGRK